RLWQHASAFVTLHPPTPPPFPYTTLFRSRWWLSSITHAFWTAALAGSLTGLLLALSLRSYAFVWETTILPASVFAAVVQLLGWLDRKSTRLNSSHVKISYAVFCLKKKKNE